MIGGNILRKFLKSEIDLMYNELQADEKILWRGKPRLFPNFSYISTLLLLFIVSIVYIILRLIKINELQTGYKDWYTVSLIIFAVLIIVYLVIYIDNYYRKMKNLFYVVTDHRLVIFNAKKQKIIYTKLYPTIKILRLKKSFFDPGSIIFDIDIINEKIIEIGFNNIDEADKVLNIINKQLTNLREDLD